LTEKLQEHHCIVAIRIRGTISALREARETLQMLHLNRNNNGVLIDNRPSFIGMLRKVQSFITWGEPTKETLVSLIKKKARTIGDKKATDEYAVKSGFKSLDDLAKAVYECRVTFNDLPDIQPTLRLHPPTKGYKNKIKRSFAAGGESGYRGDKINELIIRMI